MFFHAPLRYAVITMNPIIQPGYASITKLPVIPSPLQVKYLLSSVFLGDNLVVLPGSSLALSVGNSKRHHWDTVVNIAQWNFRTVDVGEDLVSNAAGGRAGHETVRAESVGADRSVLGSLLQGVDERIGDCAVGNDSGVSLSEHERATLGYVDLLASGNCNGQSTIADEGGVIARRAVACLSSASEGARRGSLWQVEPEFAAVGVEGLEVEWLDVSTNDQAIGWCREGGGGIWVLA